MVDTQTTARADAMRTARDLGRTAVENLVKEAVAEAMRELEEERGSSRSGTRRVSAAILLLGIGALIGFTLATRQDGEAVEPGTGISRSTEAEPSTAGPTGGTEPGDSTATEDEDEVDATTSD